MKKTNENYLEKVPIISPALNHSSNQNGIVTLEQENTGIVNHMAQKLFKKPKISYIHLDEFGSFVWLCIDGEKNLLQIGEDVKARFGDNAEPLYPRLAQYFQTLENYRFISFK